MESWPEESRPNQATLENVAREKVGRGAAPAAAAAQPVTPAAALARPSAALAAGGTADATPPAEAPAACHLVEDVAGRVFSRHLAPPLPRARITFDLSAMNDGAECLALIEPCLRKAALADVVMINGPRALMVTGLLLSRIRDITVYYVLDPGLRWQAGDWDALRDLVGLQRHFQDRLKLFALDDGLTGTIAALGGTAFSAALVPVPARRRPRMGRVAILLGRGAGEIPAFGHVAAAVALTVAEAGDRVGAILVPEDMVEITPLLRAFGLGKRLMSCLSTTDALARLAGTPVVYLAPFPDGLIDRDALVVLEQGGLVLVGPGAVPLPPSAGDALSSCYWEQADELAAKLVVLVRDYHARWAMLHDSTQQSAAPASFSPHPHDQAQLAQPPHAHAGPPAVLPASAAA